MKTEELMKAYQEIYSDRKMIQDHLAFKEWLWYFDHFPWLVGWGRPPVFQQEKPW